MKPGWTTQHAEERRGFFSPEGVLGQYPHWEKYLGDLHGQHHGRDHWRTLATRVVR